MVQSVQNDSPYENENLFSRHYLKKVIQRTNIWEVDEDEVEEAFEELEEIYDEEKNRLPHRTDDEEEVRNDFITPILRRVLDFKKEQEKTSGNSQRIPDYALYDTNEKKDKAVESGDYYKHAIGLVEAKAWKKDLEKKTSTGDPSTDGSNPTKQIVDYLIENKPQWGMLTNGKKWRLVHREASNRLDTYYEVDIENLLTSERPREERLEEFKYFYIFFRKQAFQGDEGDKVLDEILEESLQYAEEIGEDLEENIYEALEWIAKGFTEIKKNKERGIEEESIEDIHKNSLILLYRILFVLYADSRGILGNPEEEGYEDYSINSLIDEVTTKLDENDGDAEEAFSHGTLKWLQLNNQIFPMIDKGSQSEGIPKDEFFIPAYNGGLFDQDNYPFLRKYTLRDSYLAKVIDLVARTKKGEQEGKARVDYYDLSVRHLGGIYEGLLEYQLEKADKEMVKVKEDGSEVVKTVEEAEEDGDSFSDDDIIEEGEPYLVTDDGERKATGSYYTPDYIVKYIVENTVGPKVEEEIEGLETDEEKAEAILDMQILDPAMGSAHFLVEVIDYLATELVDHKEIEIEQAKREVARQCVYGVDVNPLATELGKLSIWLKTISEDKPLSFLDHHIKTGNSLIGADIHDINRHPEEDEDSERQVTIGEEFGDENAGVVRANVQEMLKKFKEIQEKQADSPEDIKEQEQLYQEFLDFPFRKRFDVLADVYTSHYFDNNYKVDDYNRLLQAFKLSEQKEEGDEEWNEVIKEDWVQKATDSLDNSHEEDNISSQKGFFHWKLEFPEVFFDIEEGVEKEDSGFDAVVGNPPYFSVRGKGTGTLTQAPYYEYLKESNKWSKYFRSQSDVYYYFVTLSNNLLRAEGEFGYIIENYWLENDYADKLREDLLDRSNIKQLIDFEDIKIFESAGNDTCILIAEKTGVEGEKFKYISCNKSFSGESLDRRNKKLVSHISDKSVLESYSDQFIEIFEIDHQDIGTGKWTLSKETQILDLLKKDGEKIYPLDDLASDIQDKAPNDFKYDVKGDLPESATKGLATVNQGMSPGNKEVFGLEYEEAQNLNIDSEFIVPLLLNSEIGRYRIDYEDNRLIYPYSVENLSEHPALEEYLKSRKDELTSGSDRKRLLEKGEIEWYEFSVYRNRELFESGRKKIVCPYRANENSFAIDDRGSFATTDVYGIVPDADKIDMKYLLGVLNSSLLTFWYKESGKSKGGMLEYFSTPLKRMPIYKAVEEEQDRIKKLTDQISNLKDQRSRINTQLMDYIASSSEGKTLGEMYMPVEGLSDSILTDTKEDRDNIKIGSVEFEEQNNSLILSVSVKYKPEDDEGFDDEELDRWGYYETDLMPAMNFTVGDKMKALIKEFVPVAVDEAGGFANFREKATKTNSVVDRLDDLTLPKLDDVEQGLEKFIENKEEAEELEKEIQETDEQIDAIVFDLYDLTEEEVETVLDSLDTPEGEKASIMEEFRSLS